MKQTSKKKWNDYAVAALVKIIPPSNNTYVTTICDLLWELYNCKERHYHTSYHITWMFDKAKEMGLKLSVEQELAILFHDAVYTPGAPVPKNEEASAGLMRCLLSTPLYGDKNESERMEILFSASNIIGATALHFNPNPGLCQMEEGAELVLDLDLANLASPYREFCEWGNAVMLEIPSATIEGRKKFLKSLLKREQIFLTEEFVEVEKSARENIQRWIDEN